MRSFSDIGRTCRRLFALALFGAIVMATTEQAPGADEKKEEERFPDKVTLKACGPLTMRLTVPGEVTC